jgi:hypothetical protein
MVVTACIAMLITGIDSGVTLASSLLIVPVAVPMPMVASVGADKVTVKFSLFSNIVSPRRMAETAALLSDEVFPDVPLRQWVISFPFPLRFLFAAHPQAMGKVLGVVYRAISTHLIHKAGYRLKDGATGAVTLIQRFGSALNLNIHFHILFLDGAYIYRNNRPPGFQRVKAPAESELKDLAQLISQRVGRCLERQGLLEQDTESAWLLTGFDASFWGSISFVKPKPSQARLVRVFCWLGISSPSFAPISMIAPSPATEPPDADGHRIDGHRPASFRRSNASSISAL